VKVADGPVDIHRTVNAVGCVSVAGHQITVGGRHAGRRINLRIDGDLAHVLVDGTITRTVPLTLTPAQRHRLRNAQIAGPPPVLDGRPERTQRRVSARGTTQVIGQKVPDSATPAGTSPSRSTKPCCASTTNPATRSQPGPPHQHQATDPAQGLRFHPQPHNRLGTVTPQLEPNRPASSGTRHEDQDLSCSG
jgi:hypothetical protein